MTQTREKILSFGTFRFVPSRQQLFDGDRPCASAAVRWVCFGPGRECRRDRPKDKLIEAVWSGIWVDEANLRANIGALRRVLGDGLDGRRYFRTFPVEATGSSNRFTAGRNPLAAATE